VWNHTNTSTLGEIGTDLPEMSTGRWRTRSRNRRNRCHIRFSWGRRAGRRLCYSGTTAWSRARLPPWRSCRRRGQRV